MPIKFTLGILTLVAVLTGCATSPNIVQPLRWTVAKSAVNDMLG